MSDILDKLIYMLCEERGEKVPKNLNFSKGDYFRALCNVRPPRAVSEEFIALQDEYLTSLTNKKGVVDVDGLEYVNGVAVWQGDITRLKCDSIVNACNCALLGCFSPLHNCIDNAIHSAAGVQVRLDCNKIMGGREEKNGQVKVTKGYNLPSKYIFHTVGPIVSGHVTSQNEDDLKSCYLSCLNKAEEMGLKTIAFCCLSTGVYGYPKKEACRVAVSTVLERLTEFGKAGEGVKGVSGERVGEKRVGVEGVGCVEGVGEKNVGGAEGVGGGRIRVIFNVFSDDDRRVYLDELRSRGIVFNGD
jgi:O-acetyl-ADP-ribose deacetylase (regulator of RNase III)